MYQNVLARVYNQPHLLRPEKLEAIRRVVTARAVGLHLDAATIAAARADREQNQQAATVNRSVAVLPVMGTLAMRLDLMEDASEDALASGFPGTSIAS